MTVLDSFAQVRRLPIWGRIANSIWTLEGVIAESRTSGRPQDDTRTRIAVILICFIIAFGVLVVGATRAAMFSGIQPREAYLAPALERADIVDRNGSLVAINLVYHSAFLEPSLVWDKEETGIALRKAFGGEAQARAEKAYQSGKRIVLAQALPPREMERIRELGIAGVEFEPDEVRRYPAGSTAAHIVGFTDSGGKGLAGIERGLDDEIRALGAEGKPLKLTLDMRVQSVLDEEIARAGTQFNARGAVGIVMNVHNGEILGMSSFPFYDANQAGRSSPDALLNRASGQVFEMGSTFKAFTVAIGLDTGVATPKTMFDATRPMQLGYRTIRDYHATNRNLSMTDVFTHSSNIGSAKIALAVGPERLSAYYDAFGLTRASGLELAENARPLVPKKWNRDTLASISMGHGMNVTPIALAEAYAALLNGGLKVRSTLVKSDEPAKPGVRVVSPETSRAVLEMMRANVANGTGGKAEARGYFVGGKTGTGEKSVGGKYDTTRQVSSFAATFPSVGPLDARRYFVLVLLDEPQGTAQTFGQSTGGWVAAPVVSNVVDRIGPMLGMRRAPDMPVLAAAAGR